MMQVLGHIKQAPMSLSGLAPFDRKGHQRRLVVDALRRARRASRAELAAATGLTPQMVTLLVDELICDGLISEVGRRQAVRGQPPIDLALNPEGGFAIGLQIDKGRLTGLIADLKARIRAHESIACRTEDPAAALPSVCGLIDNLIGAAGVKRERIWGAGLVLPGPFGVATDPVDPLAMPAWTRRDFTGGYAAALGMPLIVGNDATAAAIGEHLNGVARDLRSFVYLYLGEGVGGGLFVEGHPLTGTFGNAGEIGRMLTSDPDGRAGLVPLESIASIGALRNMLVEAGSAPDVEDEPEALLARVPAVTQRWFDRAAATLRVTIANVENLFDPDTIVLGGPLPGAALKELAARIEPLPLSVSQRNDRTHPRLMIGSSRRTLPALGGATLPLFQALTPLPRAARLARQGPAARQAILLDARMPQ
jgi:predicted NBD/HSP70 family sugar kinase